MTLIITLTTNKNTNTINVNQVISENEYIVSSNGFFIFHVHNDGISRIINAPVVGVNEIYNPKVIWSCGKSTPNNKSTKTFNVQGDGNLVMYVSMAHNPVLWTANTQNKGGIRFVLENNGNLVFYNSNGGIVWHSNSGSRMFNFLPTKNKNTDTINLNERILEDEYIMSKNNLNLFHVDDDGYARLFGFPSVQTNLSDIPEHLMYWFCGTGTGSRDLKHFDVQGDSNLVLYTDNNNKHNVLWSSSTVGRGGIRVVLENERNLVFYHSNGGIIWQSNTPMISSRVKEGSSVKCTDKSDKGEVYRWTYNKLFHYPNPEIANTWDPNFANFTWYNCTDNINSGVMSKRPNDNDVFKCTDSGDKLYSYNYTNNQLTHYPIVTDAFLRSYNKYTGGTWNNSFAPIYDCQQYNPNRLTLNFPSATNVPDSMSVKCYDLNNSITYRKINDTLMEYPNNTVADTWDSNWNKPNWYNCSSVELNGVMSSRPNDGDIIKCNETGDNFYRYNKKNNQLTYYPIITDNILRQYNNYTGTTVWNNTMFSTENCDQYNPTRLELKTFQPLNTNTTDGTSLMCDRDKTSVYRYTSNNDSLSHYPTPEIANTWDPSWSNYKLYDCSRIWSNNSGINYNLISSKPSNGSLLKCSDDNNYYRYSEDTNKLFKYDTPAIAKQYSPFFIIQQTELNIGTGKIKFVNQPDYDNTKTVVAYTFSFDCCIERTSATWRNILNSSSDDSFPVGTNNRRPGIYISGQDVTPANRIQIVHSTTGDLNSKIISNFEATPGKWFTVTYIVNNRSMFTYFGNENEDKKKDKSYSNGTSFTWASGSKNWTWNSSNTTTQGFIKVRNVRFWKFAMALHVPETFDPIEITDELSPYTNRPTGNKEYTTSLPPPTNCKAFSNPRSNFIPTQTISPATTRDGTTLKCKDNQDKYRYNAENRKLFKYPDDSIAQSWDPNYNNYKAYDCQNFLTNISTLEKKPADKNVIKCTDDNKSYRYINDTNTLEWYMNDNIIKQYNPDWTITQRMTRNCDQFKNNRPTFFPTQKLEPGTTSLQEGTPLKCNNQPDIYRYNSRYEVLMKYPNEIIANSWDPVAWKGYYSYDCSQEYITNKGVMNERPKQNTVINCNNMQNNTFKYTYNFDDNSLKPWTSIQSIQKAFPTWNVNNIQNNDCRQYYIREPRFYDGPNGTGTETKITPSNYEGCNVLPYVPTDYDNRSLIRDGENVFLYTDPSCQNIYTNVDGNKQKDNAVNITYTPTNAIGIPLNESNPTNYKIVGDDEYYTLYPN